MSDSKNIVTGLFVLVAVALSVSAWVVYPKPASSGMEEQVNKPLFDFDPKSVRGLSIVKYNEQRNEFDEVVMQNSVLKRLAGRFQVQLPRRFGRKIGLHRRQSVWTCRCGDCF